MIRPPMILRIKVRNRDTHINLWLPLFLIIPILLILLLPFLPFILLGSLVLLPTRWGKTALYAVPMVFYVILKLRGLKVDIKQPENEIYFSVH